MKKTILAATMMFVLLFLGCSQAPKFSDSFDDVSAWKPFMGPKSKVSVSADKTIFKEGLASLKLDFTNLDWAGIGREFADKPAWSAKSALSFQIKGDGTPHHVSVELSDNGGERFNKIISINSSDWQVVVIPLKDLTRRKDWQPDKAPVDGLTLTHVEGLSFSVGEKETGSLHIDDLKLVKK